MWERRQTSGSCLISTNADVSKANKLLGYESSVTVEEGIKRTVAWYKQTFGEDGMGGRKRQIRTLTIGSAYPVWKVV